MMNEFTIRQIADLLEVSKPTVQKIVDSLDIKPIRIDNTNCRFYSLEDAERIISERTKDFDFSVLRQEENETAKAQNIAPNEAQSGAKLQSEAPNEQREPQNGAKAQSDSDSPQNPEDNVNELELLRQTIDIIKKELEEKNRQLSIKDKQIQDLSDRLAEVIQLNKGQQYIAAAEKTTGLLEADSKKAQQEDTDIVIDNVEDNSPAAPDNIEEEPEQKKKKGFWRRLFGI